LSAFSGSGGPGDGEGFGAGEFRFVGGHFFCFFTLLPGALSNFDGLAAYGNGGLCTGCCFGRAFLCFSCGNVLSDYIQMCYMVSAVPSIQGDGFRQKDDGILFWVEVAFL